MPKIDDEWHNLKTIPISDLSWNHDLPSPVNRKVSLDDLKAAYDKLRAATRLLRMAGYQMHEYSDTITEVLGPILRLTIRLKDKIKDVDQFHIYLDERHVDKKPSPVVQRIE